MPYLIKQIEERYDQLDFFQALSLLEEYFQKKEGVKDIINSGTVHFSSSTSLTFPPNDIDAIIVNDNGTIRFILSFMGLLGVSSPLPHYFSEYIMKYKDESSALSDFLAIFNHRIYALFYRAWKKYRIANMSRENGAFGLADMIVLLAGIHESVLPKNKKILAYTGILSQSCRSAEGLKVILSDYFNTIPVSITEWVPRWAEIHELKKLGADTVLGHSTMIGTHIKDYSGKFQVILGPLDKETFETFLPDSANIAMVKEIALKYLADPLDFDIEVKLKPAVLSPVILGTNNAALGITTSCGRSREKSDEYSIVITN